MPHNRFFVDAPLIEGEYLEIGDQERRHTNVMRLRIDDPLELVNGRHQLAQATIKTLSKRTLTVKITAVHSAPIPRSIIIGQALPRINRLDFIAEKGTELGMTELWLFPGEKSEKTDLSDTQMRRLELITIAAMKQCGRLDLPKILLKPPLVKWETLPPTSYFGDPLPSAPQFHPKSENQILFIIGPEGGLTPTEKSHLQKRGAQGVRLHHNILRTETASLVALSQLTL